MESSNEAEEIAILVERIESSDLQSDDVHFAAALGHPAAAAYAAGRPHTPPSPTLEAFTRLDEAWVRTLLSIAATCPQQEHPDVRLRLEPLARVVSCPCREHAQALHDVENPPYPKGDVRASIKVARLALQAARSNDPTSVFDEPEVIEDLLELTVEAWAKSSEAEKPTVDTLRAAVRRDVVPWLFGLVMLGRD
jgi:hypothetical protein